MEFSLNDTQLLLQETAQKLMRDRYGFEQRKAILASPDGFSRALWKEYAALGLLGIETSEEHGGSGGRFHDLAVVLEAFGGALVVEPYLSTVVLGAGLVAAAGSKAQQERLLPRLAGGELMLALAYGEPNARYALNHVEASARRNGGGHLLSGHKAVVLGADSADVLIVPARTSGAATDRQGVSLFLVERNAPGVTVHGYPTIDDRRAGEVLLDAVNVGADALLGPLDGGLPHLESAIDRGAAALCCEAVGAMTALNALTLDYLQTREQFGRPIGKFQVLAHRMADMVMAEQQARSMALLAIEHADSADAAARAKAISAAKAQIGSSAQIVGRGAIQLHGGIGMTLEYSAGHYFRRLSAIEMMFGDQSYHLERFAAA
jgi:alkylation response protein AidB-like acyl-CoA dehydrogenase